MIHRNENKIHRNENKINGFLLPVRARIRGIAENALYELEIDSDSGGIHAAADAC